MKNKSIAGLIISQRKPDGEISPSHSEDNPDQGLEACAEDLIRAVHAKDSRGVVAALRAAWEMMDSPQDDESYAAQNAKAAKEQP